MQAIDSGLVTLKHEKSPVSLFAKTTIQGTSDRQSANQSNGLINHSVRNSAQAIDNKYFTDKLLAMNILAESEQTSSPQVTDSRDVTGSI
jgi:hypothetical protein